MNKWNYSTKHMSRKFQKVVRKSINWVRWSEWAVYVWTD